MHYKTQSMITIGILVGIMVFIGIGINNLEGSITGAVIAPACDCNDNSDCGVDGYIGNPFCNGPRKL